MKNLVKVIKTLFDRSSITDQFDNFKKFLHSHIKAPDWSKLEESWEDFWLPTLSRSLGQILSKMILVGVSSLVKTDQEKVKKYLAENAADVSLSKTRQWVQIIRKNTVLTKKRLTEGSRFKYSFQSFRNLIKI